MECKSKGSVYVCVLCKPFVALCVTVGCPVFVYRWTRVTDWCICTAQQNVNWHSFVSNKVQGLNLEIMFKHLMKTPKNNTWILEEIKLFG